ncbi:DJ-1/PfpI family protein [Paracoccus pacificus]|uniref:DJ-1/PfpI family protein n=1 Tax=Paracoccus pacificus TaxID=1463598 RepID=A0ABW4R6Q5_9RHOB
MNRRDFNTTAAMAALLATFSAQAEAQQSPQNSQQTSPQQPKRKSRLPPLNYTMLIYPGMVFQDLLGPLMVFRLTMATPRLVWKTREPVSTDVDLPVPPTHTLDDCPDQADVLFVPGGLRGTTAMLQDDAVLGFLRDKAPHARFVTSVCTGSLILGAAGLLQGKKATSHWNVTDLLPLFGAIPTDGRVVQDGNIITGGGVTAGLDFGLTIAAILRGDDWAKKTMLTLEYAPEPPFVGGTPDRAEPENVAAVTRMLAPSKAAARKAAGA